MNLIDLSINFDLFNSIPFMLLVDYIKGILIHLLFNGDII